MDCLFNKQIPQSSNNELIFPPAGKTFITGLAFSYQFYYDPTILGSKIKETQFNYLMNSLNDELYTYWPCPLCFYSGYLFSPCTLGLSFFCPYTCIGEARKHFNEKLEHYNRNHFNPKGLNLTYHQKCSSSWLKLGNYNTVIANKTKKVFTNSSINMIENISHKEIDNKLDYENKDNKKNNDNNDSVDYNHNTDCSQNNILDNSSDNNASKDILINNKQNTKGL